jgi:hypothetical protein
MLHKDYDREESISTKKVLVVSHRRLDAKTNRLAVNHQSESNYDSDSELVLSII